jgi:hypothetical protein
MDYISAEKLVVYDIAVGNFCGLYLRRDYFSFMLLRDGISIFILTCLLGTCRIVIRCISAETVCHQGMLLLQYMELKSEDELQSGIRASKRTLLQALPITGCVSGWPPLHSEGHLSCIPGRDSLPLCTATSPAGLP